MSSIVSTVKHTAPAPSDEPATKKLRLQSNEPLSRLEHIAAKKEHRLASLRSHPHYAGRKERNGIQQKCAYCDKRTAWYCVTCSETGQDNKFVKCVAICAEAQRGLSSQCFPAHLRQVQETENHTNPLLRSNNSSGSSNRIKHNLENIFANNEHRLASLRSHPHYAGRKGRNGIQRKCAYCDKKTSWYCVTCSETGQDNKFVKCVAICAEAQRGLSSQCFPAHLRQVQETENHSISLPQHTTRRSNNSSRSSSLQPLSRLEEDARIYEYTSVANPNMPQVPVRALDASLQLVDQLGNNANIRNTKFTRNAIPHQQSFERNLENIVANNEHRLASLRSHPHYTGRKERNGIQRKCAYCDKKTSWYCVTCSETGQDNKFVKCVAICAEAQRGLSSQCFPAHLRQVQETENHSISLPQRTTRRSNISSRSSSHDRNS